MGSYGRETLDVFGATGITVTADGAPVAKVAAATLSWAGVPAHDAAERTFKHDDLVDATEKFIRYGTVICRITAATDGSEVGKFMPYMATPGGGRTLSTAEGDVFVVNESIHYGDRNSDYPVAIDGGRVYKRRLLVVGYGDGTEGVNTAVAGAVTRSTTTVASIAVADAGSGYTVAPTVVITGGGGTGATATATLGANGTITGIVVTAAGTGYTSDPTATFVSSADPAHLYDGAKAENAADLAYLNIDAFVAATFKTALPQITFVTES